MVINHYFITKIGYQPWQEGVRPLSEQFIKEQSRGRKRAIFVEQIGQEVGRRVMGQAKTRASNEREDW